MTIQLNRRAFDHAKELIGKHRFVSDDRDRWSEDAPSTQKENEFIKDRGFEEYGKWHLGIDPEQDEENKGRYKFPYGDFDKVHRCALLSAESRAGQYKHEEVKSAVAHLHGMLDQASS